MLRDLRGPAQPPYPTSLDIGKGTSVTDLLRCIAILASAALAGCSTPPTTLANDASSPPSASAASPPVASAPASAAPASTATPDSAAASAAAPAASASAPASASASAAAPSASASAAAEAPLPKVNVANIGMHIGGGPNDEITKAPIHKSVEPHLDEFRRCFALVEDPKKGGDFGVDLRIDKAGGKAKVSHPRTTLKGKDFVDCVVHTYEGIDFLKPRKGTTVVSYSLRFTP